MVLLLALHLVVGVGLMAATSRLAGRRLLFLLAAIPPLATLVWLVVQLPDVVDGEVLTETVEWIPELGVDLALRLDGFAALMLVLVAGIGVLVIAYSASYFAEPDAAATFACSACSCCSPGR